MKTIGTITRGIKGPIIKEGDDLVNILVSSLLDAAKEGEFSFHDRDIVGVTEAVVARAQGNYASLDQIAKDVRQKTNCDTIGLVFPILSRNRFSMILKGISHAAKKLVIQLSYPSDEVGNPLVPLSLLDEKKVNPYTDSFTEKTYYEKFGKILHPFTGIDYIELYKTYCECECEIIVANNPLKILEYTDVVINADIHSRARTKNMLKQAGAKICLSLNDLLTESVDGSGYNELFGLYGSNIATDTTVKLFPRDPQAFVNKVQQSLKKETGKNIEVLVYGDGAFKDPIGGIWELADPVVCPAYTDGLIGKPSELKLKYLADNAIGNSQGKEAENKIKDLIKQKKSDLLADMSSLGTTPRRLVDTIGSLCDLTSGSGDKGTPFILIQNYFDNFAND